MLGHDLRLVSESLLQDGDCLAVVHGSKGQSRNRIESCSLEQAPQIVELVNIG